MAPTNRGLTGSALRGYETEWIDDDALFDEDYAAACESEWEWMTGR